MTLMLVFSEIMTFMWQYYVTKDTKLLRQLKHSFNGLCSPSGIIQINQKKKQKSFRYGLKERDRATTIAFAIVGRAITLDREPSKKKQRTDTKKNAKRIKSDNFTGINKKSSILLSQFWKNEWSDGSAQNNVFLWLITEDIKCYFHR